MDRVTHHLLDLVRRMNELLPDANVSGTDWGRRFIVELASRQFATYQAVCLLLVHGLVQEAAALVRRQGEDLLRLVHISRVDDAAALYFGHIKSQLIEKVRAAEGLVEVSADYQSLLDTYQAELDALEGARQRAGVRYEGFPKTRQMIEALDRPGDIVPWVDLSPHVHSAVTNSGSTTLSFSPQAIRAMSNTSSRLLAICQEVAAQTLELDTCNEFHDAYTQWFEEWQEIEIPQTGSL